MEIERKYLVRSLPAALESYPLVEIEQGYLCTSPTLRIRRMGGVYWLTVKEKVSTGSSAIHNREEEFQLSAEKYLLLKEKCDGLMVCKTRYRIPLQGTAPLTAELDLFHGSHEGLRIVEVEFPDTSVADAFVPPEWFGDEVSAVPYYRNSWLAHHPYSPTR